MRRIKLRDIRSLSRRIAREFRPERIVLFGSYAYGSPSADSDVDLLIIMPFEGTPVYKASEIRLKARPHFPLDLVLRTPDDVKKRIRMGDCFMLEVMAKGKVLYEAHHS
jgi:predicted nucleotidyltransferase